MTRSYIWFDVCVSLVGVPCAALPSGGGSSVGPPLCVGPLCGSPVRVPCVGPRCGPPLRWWVLCGALPSVWVPCVGPLWVGPLCESPLCGSPVWVPCVGPLCGSPLCGSPVWVPSVWVPCVGPLCVGPLCPSARRVHVASTRVMSPAHSHAFA